ncbi:hypothetical protein STSR3_12 [Salmonella virus STSR3]|nr:hypothetical protein STSR3_12 [Salmonella virus STSR3]
MSKPQKIQIKRKMLKRLKLARKPHNRQPIRLSRKRRQLKILPLPKRRLKIRRLLQQSKIRLLLKQHRLRMKRLTLATLLRKHNLRRKNQKLALILLKLALKLRVIRLNSGLNPLALKTCCIKIKTGRRKQGASAFKSGCSSKIGNIHCKFLDCRSCCCLAESAYWCNSARRSGKRRYNKTLGRKLRKRRRWSWSDRRSKLRREIMGFSRIYSCVGCSSRWSTPHLALGARSTHTYRCGLVI